MLAFIAMIVTAQFHSHSSAVRMARSLPLRERLIARILSPRYICVTLAADGVVFDWMADDLLVYRAEQACRFRPGTPRIIEVEREVLIEPAWWRSPYRLFWRNCSHFAATMLGYPWVAGMTPDLLACILAAEVRRHARENSAHP